MPRKRSKSEDEEEIREQPSRPTPYPLDEAIEMAHNILLTEEEHQAPTEDWMDESNGAQGAEHERSESGRARAAASAAEPSEGNEQQRERNERRAEREQRLDQAGGSSEPALPSARVALPRAPESLASRLMMLAPWQKLFVLSLMETGGVIGIAALKTHVSRRSVEKHRAENPEFDAACNEAIEYSNDLLEAAGVRGATVGDTQPVYQGGLLVGYKRQRSPKDLEIMLKVRGRLVDQPQQINIKNLTKVEVSTVAEVPERVADTMQRLYAARGKQPVLDAATGRPVSK